MEPNELLNRCDLLEKRIERAINVDKVSEDKGTLLAMIAAVKQWGKLVCQKCESPRVWWACDYCDGGLAGSECPGCNGDGGWYVCPTCGDGKHE